jgi:hypothetical protein
MMRFYQQQHPFYCGVDLHARSMHVCLVNAAGQTLVHKNIDARSDRFLPLIRPYRDGLAVAAECLQEHRGKSCAAPPRRAPPNWTRSAWIVSPSF